MTTIELKIAKNGNLICKLNGKCEKRENVETAIRHANLYGGNVEIKNEFGSVYTSNFNGEIYRFVDQYGKEVTFVFADNVIYNLARANVEFTANATVEEPTTVIAETDGSEDDDDDNDEVFKYLPDFKKALLAEVRLDNAEHREREAEQIPPAMIISTVYKKRRLTVKLDGRVVSLQTAVDEAVTEHRREPITIINHYGAEFSCTWHIEEPRPRRAREYVKEFVREVANIKPFDDAEAEICSRRHKNNVKATFMREKIEEDRQACDDNDAVFSLLPAVEDLNDVENEWDEDAAEYTDRNDRYNRGEKIAEGLTAKLRAFDPTVEVTYTIDEDGEDIYYLSYDGIVRTPFTATGVESSFHAMKDDAPTEPAPVDDSQDGLVENVVTFKRSIGQVFDDLTGQLNAKAPAGWEVAYEVKVTPDKDYGYTYETPHYVTFNGKTVATLERVYIDDVRRADEFWAKFTPSPAPVKYVATQITYPNGHEGEPTREVSATFDNLDDAARFIANDNPFVETGTGFRKFAYNGYYFGGVHWAGYRIATTDGNILCEVNGFEIKGDESIDDLVYTYYKSVGEDGDDDKLIDEPVVTPAPDFDDTPPASPVDDFAEKLFAFDDAVTKAKTARDAAKAACVQADAEVENAVAAREKFLDFIAEGLTCKLHAACIDNDFIETTTVSGSPITIGDFFNVYIDATTAGKFAFVTWNNRTLARYDTPAQVETTIARLKGAIDRREPVFYFPTVKDLTTPPTPPVAPATPEPKTPAAEPDTPASTGILISFDGVNFAPFRDTYIGQAPRFFLKADGYPITVYRTTSPAYVDTVAGVARICNTVNATAPHGWEVYYEVKTNLFIVEHDGQLVDRLTSVELYDAIDAHPPEEFFDAYTPRPAVEFDDAGNVSAVWF